MRIYFHTNLDEPRLPHNMVEAFGDQVPAVGSHIAIPYYGYELGLEVVGHWYSCKERIGMGQLEVSLMIELHIPRVPATSIAEWELRLRRMKNNPL